MFNVHCPIVQQGVTELLSSAQEGERRRRRRFFDLQLAEEWNILTANHHSTKNSELCSDSCPSARLRMSLHCPSAWSRRKWQDGPAAQSSGLWLGLWTQPGITAAVRAAHHGAAKEQPRSSPAPSSSSGAALAASKRAQRAALPSAGTSTSREGVWAIFHKPQQWELWFPPSAIAPKLLLRHPAVRKEREECGSEQGTTFWGQDPVVYVFSVFWQGW